MPYGVTRPIILFVLPLSTAYSTFVGFINDNGFHFRQFQLIVTLFGYFSMPYVELTPWLRAIKSITDLRPEVRISMDRVDC